MLFRRRVVGWFIAVPIIFIAVSQTQAGFVVFDLNSNNGLTGFNAAAANPPVVIDFDAITPGTNITATTLQGVTFQSSPSGAPLIVVRGEDTFTPPGFAGVIDISTNRLPATSGEMVLSPGGAELGPGPNNAIENDDLTLTFASSVVAVGFDHLSQSADGVSFTSIQVFNQDDAVLFSGLIPISSIIGSGSPGGADFWGGVATDGDRITRIVIDESDGNASPPDSNIGFDTFRILVPEPASSLWVTLGGLALLRRRYTRGT